MPNEQNNRITAFDAAHVQRLAELRDLRNKVCDLRDETPGRLGGTLGETERAELDEIANKVAQMFNRRLRGG